MLLPSGQAPRGRGRRRPAAARAPARAVRARRACAWRSTPRSASPCYPTHGEDDETLQQRADIAMYSAKQAGRGYALFEPELDRHSPRRLALAGDLRSAINEGQIRLYYQPKADLRTGRIIGVEALARWDHPEFGIVGPNEFVPIAEQTGLITPLTSLRPGRRASSRCATGRSRARAVGRGQPVRALVPGHAARGRDPAPARPLRRRGRAARARDHRVDADDRPGARRGDADAPAPDRPDAVRSTTSAPATRRWPTSSACRST